MAPQIPDRWLKYQPIGRRIDGTRFIAFKVPLREALNKTVHEKDRLHGKLLLEKIPNLGVIIDLTNTNRYYDPNFFEKEGVEHKKLMIPGHLTPPQCLVNRFKEFVKQFIQNNPDNDKLIGVHCTHGVNRTGYLICNYMVSEMLVDPLEAIKKFAEARGHTIERGNYVDSLQSLDCTKRGQEDNATTQEKSQMNKNREPEKHTNWRTEKTKHLNKAEKSDKTEKVEQNWRIPRVPAESGEISRQNSRFENFNRSNKRHTDANRFKWRRDNPATQDTQSSGRERKRKFEDNSGISFDPTGPTTAKNIRRISHYDSSNTSYSNHNRNRQYRDSQAHYHSNQYGSNNSNYSRFAYTNPSADIKSTPRMHTDYNNASRTLNKRERGSHYSRRQQEHQQS